MFKKGQKVKVIFIFWVFFYIFLALTLWRVSTSYLDPDFGWHLKVGQEATLSHQVARDNHFNYTYQGTWVDHEWLSNWSLYKLYQRGGYVVLSFFFVALIILVLLFLHWQTNRQVKSHSKDIFIVLLLTVGLLAASTSTGIRIQELAWIFLVALLTIIYYSNKKPHWLQLIWLLPLFYLWANLHASFLLGLFVLFFWWGLKGLEKLLADWFGTERWPRWDFSQVWSASNMCTFLLFSGLSVGVTLLTPYRLALYEFLQGYQSTFYLSYIQEWLPQTSFPFAYLQLTYLGLVIVALVIYIYSIHRQEHWRFNLGKFSMVVLFVVLSFKSRRNFPLLFVSSFGFLVEIYATIFQIKQRLSWRYALVWRRILFGLIGLCLALLIVIQLGQIRFVRQPFTDFCGQYPCAAVEFLKDHPEYDDLNLFNEYVWGGFLIWVYPERQLFIDGRLPQVAYAGQTFLEEYMDFFRPGLSSQRLDQHQVNLVLLTAIDKWPREPYWWEKMIFAIQVAPAERTNQLRRYLIDSSDWQEVYRDEVAVIYQRQ